MAEIYVFQLPNPSPQSADSLLTATLLQYCHSADSDLQKQISSRLKHSTLPLYIKVNLQVHQKMRHFYSSFLSGYRKPSPFLYQYIMVSKCCSYVSNILRLCCAFSLRKYFFFCKKEQQQLTSFYVISFDSTKLGF
jgi:hypothetical protein